MLYKHSTQWLYLLCGDGSDPPTILYSDYVLYKHSTQWLDLCSGVLVVTLLPFYILIMCSIVSYKHSTQWLDLLCGDGGDPPTILYSDYVFNCVV